MRQLQSAAERETAASQCPIDPPPSPAAAAGASPGAQMATEHAAIDPAMNAAPAEAAAPTPAYTAGNAPAAAALLEDLA